MRAAGLAFLAGCIDVGTIDIADDPDAIVILALAPGSVSTSVRVVSARGGAPISLGDGDRFFAFELAPSDYVRSDGTPVTGEDLLALEVRHLSEEPAEGVASCGRCLSEFGTPPNVAHAGQSCPPPRFARTSLVRSDGSRLHVTSRDELLASGSQKELDEIEAARLSIRVEWTGACACAPASSPIAPPEFAPIQPSDRPHPLEALAQLDDGTVGGFSIGLQHVVDPAGASASTYEIMPGPVVAAGGLRAANAAAFIVAVDSSGIGDYEIAHRVFVYENGAIGGARVLELPAGFRSRGMKRIDLGAGPVLALFGDDGGASSIALCTGSETAITCDVEPVACAHGSVLDVSSSDGRVVAITALDLAVAPWMGGRPGTFECGLHAELFSTVEGGIVANPTKVGLAGDRVALCVPGSFIVPFFSRFELYLLDLGPNGLEGSVASVGPSLGLGAFSDRFPCPEFVEVESGKLEITTPLLVRAVITATAGFTTDRREDHDAIEDPSRALFVQKEEQRAPGWTLYRSGSLGSPGLGAKIYRRPRNGAAEEVYGPGDPANGWANVAEIRPHPDGFVAINLRPSHHASLVRFDENGAFRVDDLDVTLYTEDERIGRAAVDSADGSVIVTGKSDEPTSDRPWVRRFDPRSPEAGVREATLPSALDGGLSAIVEVSPGRFILATEDGAFFALTEDRIETVAPEWDDPFTPELETAPFDRSTGLDLIHVRDAAGAGGIAWIVGDRFILAARPGRDSIAALERVSPFRGRDAFSTNLASADFIRAGMRCPDRGVIAYTSIQDPEVRIVDVHPAPDASSSAPPIGPSSLPIPPHVFVPGAYPGMIRADLASSPSAIHVAPDDRPTYVFDRTRLVLRGDAFAGHLPFPALSSAAIGSGLLVSGHDGRLALGVPSTATAR